MSGLASIILILVILIVTKHTLNWIFLNIGGIRDKNKARIAERRKTDPFYAMTRDEEDLKRENIGLKNEILFLEYEIKQMRNKGLGGVNPGRDEIDVALDNMAALTREDRILVQQCTSDTTLQNEIMKRLDTIEKNTLYSSDSPYNIWKDRK